MHEILHAMGMDHEQSRPDRNDFIKVDLSNTEADPQFEITPNGDTRRPYDILSLMHYGAYSFATDRNKPVITVKEEGYEKYTTDPSKYNNYKIGNRIGMAQSDVDQLAEMYSTVVDGTCVASKLSEETTCVDKKKDGQPFSDSYGDCDKYRLLPASDPCSHYTANRYCCGCGGGWEVQEYECKDSTTYKDPKFDEDCHGWVGYNCKDRAYRAFSRELLANCPKACGLCD